MMNHSEIQKREIIERYVRRQLDDEERRAFQEHFFTCDDCFSEVEATEKFIGGVRNAAESGLLEAGSIAAEASPMGNRFRWLTTALAVSAGVTLIMGATVVWLLLVRLPAMRKEIASLQQGREQIEAEKQREIDQLNARLQSQQQSDVEAASRTQNERGRPTQERPGTAGSTSPKSSGDVDLLLAKNIPVVALQATRSSNDVNEIKLGADAKRFVCWIEIGSQEFKSFSLSISSHGRTTAELGNLKLNRKHAVEVTLDVNLFAPDDYVVKLYGVEPTQRVLIGGYKLRVTRN